MQSSAAEKLVPEIQLNIPHNIAVTLNGHRRAAKELRIPLSEAYSIGAERAFEFAGWAKDAGVMHVTFYALSCFNLIKRPPEQIDALMDGAMAFCDLIDGSGTTVHVFGDLDALSAIERYKPVFERLAHFRTFDPSRKEFVIHVAVNYIGTVEHELAPLMDALYDRGFADVRGKLRNFIRSAGVPDVDLSIRTGGEQRISGFVPFQMAQAELYFLGKSWVEFTKHDFDQALRWFAKQQRNHGK